MKQHDHQLRIYMCVLTLIPVVISTNKECLKSVHGFEYVGTRNHTRSGRICQAWASQKPHHHPYVDETFYPEPKLDLAENHCRNPDSRKEGPWCYVLNYDTKGEQCDIPQCNAFPECRISETAKGYLGWQSVTSSGKTCKKWSKLTRREQIMLTKASWKELMQADKHSNYCRNPGSKPAGPWCFVEGDEGSWGYCDVPFCKPSASCKSSSSGSEYAGTVSQTVSGLPCQRWDVQYPHPHTSTDPGDFPDASLSDAANYCRNPTNDSGGLWCYTTAYDVERQFCDVPLCADCRVTDAGETYSGTVAETSEGISCQAWLQQTPHSHNMTDDDRFPDANVAAAKNYCRNPDRRSGGPWCYTSNTSVEWAFCDIPMCSAKDATEDVPATPLARHVLHIGIDGLKPSCIADAPGGAPNLLTRLRLNGTSTLTKARSTLITVSVPSWTSTLCGMDPERHGVLDNDWQAPWRSGRVAITPNTGNKVPLRCVFDVVKSQDDNIRTAFFYDWERLKVLANYGRPGSVDKELFINWDRNQSYVADSLLVQHASDYLQSILNAATSSYTFLYLVNVDETGHQYEWCGQEYLNAIAHIDALVGKMLNAIDDAGRTEEVLVMLSTDHGGRNDGHGRMADSDIMIPMFLNGPGISKSKEFQYDVSNTDIVPTAVYAMGLKPNKDWTGSIMHEAFENAPTSDEELTPYVKHVLHIGIDGLKPSCMEDTPGGMPNVLTRLRAKSRYTLRKARTVLRTYSTPSWNSILCGMQVEEHGVQSNSWKPSWLGHEVLITPVTGKDTPFPCVYEVLKAHNESIQTAQFYAGDAFSVIGNEGRPGTVNKDFYIDYKEIGSLTTDWMVIGNASEHLKKTLTTAKASYTFAYVLNVDVNGHTHSWCSREYKEAVDIADEMVGVLLDTLEEVGMTNDVMILLSSDHGGTDWDHGRMTDDDIHVPIFISIPGLTHGDEFSDDVSVTDMVPTATHAMGIRPSKHWTGRVMKEVFEE